MASNASKNNLDHTLQQQNPDYQHSILNKTHKIHTSSIWANWIQNSAFSHRCLSSPWRRASHAFLASWYCLVTWSLWMRSISISYRSFLPVTLAIQLQTILQRLISHSSAFQIHCPIRQSADWHHYPLQIPTRQGEKRVITSSHWFNSPSSLSSLNNGSMQRLDTFISDNGITNKEKWTD